MRDRTCDVCGDDLPTREDRKNLGAYYTPADLIAVLLNTTLDPVIDAAVERGEARDAIEEELLGLTVCDPSCGSGHFLYWSARRIAERLAAVRTGHCPHPRPDVGRRRAKPLLPGPASAPEHAVQAAMRDVIGRCIYGVDLNPVAVDMAKVTLWLASLREDKPNKFLDHHIRCGNTLIGATPALMAKGIPDEAWNPIEGDDKAVARALKKRNRTERLAREQRERSQDVLF